MASRGGVSNLEKAGKAGKLRGNKNLRAGKGRGKSGEESGEGYQKRVPFFKKIKNILANTLGQNRTHDKI